MITIITTNVLLSHNIHSCWLSFIFREFDWKNVLLFFRDFFPPSFMLRLEVKFLYFITQWIIFFCWMKMFAEMINSKRCCLIELNMDFFTGFILSSNLMTLWHFLAQFKSSDMKCWILSNADHELIYKWLSIGLDFLPENSQILNNMPEVYTKILLWSFHKFLYFTFN